MLGTGTIPWGAIPSAGSITFRVVDVAVPRRVCLCRGLGELERVVKRENKVIEIMQMIAAKIMM